MVTEGGTLSVTRWATPRLAATQAPRPKRSIHEHQRGDTDVIVRFGAGIAVPTYLCHAASYLHRCRSHRRGSLLWRHDPGVPDYSAAMRGASSGVAK